MTSEIINIENWGKCLKLSNGKIEITTTLDLGPRIIGFNLIGGQNFLNQIGKVDPTETPWGNYYNYGGHRLWHSPEALPRTYYPDNDPIKYELTGTGAIFFYNTEVANGIDKKFEIVLGDGETVEIKHTITNVGHFPLKIAPWALTIMAPGGELIVPNEPFIPHTDCLLPARPLVLWHYTNMADPRWTWGEKFTCLRNDSSIDKAMKVGFLDKVGWAAYKLKDSVFIKSFDYVEGAEYPDYMCNLETFTKATFHEFETVAPLSELAPNGGSADYVEKWSLFDNVKMTRDEDNMADVLSGLVKKIK